MVNLGLNYVRSHARPCQYIPQNENNNNKSTIGTEEATNTEANTEEIGGSKLRQHANKFHEEGATAAHKEEMEEKNEQKINEYNKEMKMNTKT